MEINEIISIIASPGIQAKLLWLKIIFLLFAFLFLGSIFYFLLNTRWLKWRAAQDLVEIITFRPYGVKKIVKQWLKIKKRLESGLESEYKLTIIEADSMLDELLKKAGYNGETLEDKLKLLTIDLLPGLETIREAHKIRDNIVYDPDYKLTLEQAQKTLAVYEETFADLQVF